MRTFIGALALLSASSGGAAGSVISADRISVTARASQAHDLRPYLSAAEATALRYIEHDLADNLAPVTEGTRALKLRKRELK